MSTRNIKDAKDLSSGELIYFKSHAKATYMSDGITVEDAINDLIENGGGNNNGTAAPGATPIINHGTSDTTIELTPNTIHKWDEIDSLSITLPVDEGGFANHYKIIFSVSTDSFSLQIPSNLKWPDNTPPVFEITKQYEMSIEDNRIAFLKFSGNNTTGTFLEYIENDGTDYILTDYVMGSKDCGYAFKARVLSETKSYNIILGTSTGTADSGSPFSIYTRSSTTTMIGTWNGSNKTIVATQELDKDYEIGLSMSALTLACEYPLCIFTRNEKGTPASAKVAHARIYYIKILDVNGNPNLDLRPFRRASDGAIGLLDIVTDTFYPSANGNMIL